jgi:ureidoglycolate lyase
MKLIELSIEPLTEEAFMPFGEIVATKNIPPVFTGLHMESWPFKFSIDKTVELMFNRFYYHDIEFSMMERHFFVTQAFLPLNGMPMVMVVGPPTEATDPLAIPGPEDLRAFYVDGNQGIMLWRGTWHALHRFPVRPPYVDIALITEAETQHELEDELSRGAAPKRTQAIDLEKLKGVRFRVVDPGKLMA